MSCVPRQDVSKLHKNPHKIISKDEKPQRYKRNLEKKLGIISSRIYNCIKILNKMNNWLNYKWHIKHRRFWECKYAN